MRKLRAKLPANQPALALVVDDELDLLEILQAALVEAAPPAARSRSSAQGPFFQGQHRWHFASLALAAFERVVGESRVG